MGRARDDLVFDEPRRRRPVCKCPACAGFQLGSRMRDVSAVARASELPCSWCREPVCRACQAPRNPSPPEERWILEQSAPCHPTGQLALGR